MPIGLDRDWGGRSMHLRYVLAPPPAGALAFGTAARRRKRNRHSSKTKIPHGLHRQDGEYDYDVVYVRARAKATRSTNATTRMSPRGPDRTWRRPDASQATARKRFVKAPTARRHRPRRLVRRRGGLLHAHPHPQRRRPLAAALTRAAGHLTRSTSSGEITRRTHQEFSPTPAGRLVERLPKNEKTRRTFLRR